MKSKKIGDSTLWLKFKTQKDLNLTFFRISEFSESKYPDIFRKAFGHEEWLENYVNRHGHCYYFQTTVGHNVPGDVFVDFFAKFRNTTRRERELFQHVRNKVDFPDRWYFIATLKEADRWTIRHEVTHSMFWLNGEYREAVRSVLLDVDKKDYRKFEKALRKMCYGDSAIIDEMNAYLTTEKKSDFEYKFGLKMRKYPVKELKKLKKKFFKGEE